MQSWTVEDTVQAVGQAYARLGAPNPRLNRHGDLDIRLTSLYCAWSKVTSPLVASNLSPFPLLPKCWPLRAWKGCRQPFPPPQPSCWPSISYFAGFPFDNACNIYESAPTDYVGSFNLVTGDGQSGASPVTIDAESTAYSYSLQDMIRFRDPSAFPAIPQFQREDSQWMTPDQESATRLLGWTSVVVIFLVTLIVSRSLFNLALQKFICRPYRPTGKASNQQFSETTERYGYVPRIKSPHFQYPLLACNMSSIDPDLVDWSDPSSSFPFDKHNLIYDVPDFTKGNGKQVFSVYQIMA